MDGETVRRLQFAITLLTLEMFRLLMLYENLFVVELAVAEVAEGLELQSLPALPSHRLALNICLDSACDLAEW